MPPTHMEHGQLPMAPCIRLRSSEYGRSGRSDLGRIYYHNDHTVNRTAYTISMSVRVYRAASTRHSCVDTRAWHTDARIEGCT